MALVLSVVMPAIGLIVERFGGNATEIKKKDSNQPVQLAQPLTTSLGASCINIDDLGLKFT